MLGYVNRESWNVSSYSLFACCIEILIEFKYFQAGHSSLFPEFLKAVRTRHPDRARRNGNPIGQFGSCFLGERHQYAR